MTVETFLVVVFWLGVSWAIYAYVVFPAGALLLARRSQRAFYDGRTPPNAIVTVIIPAYNEEQNIGARIRNVLTSSYPAALLDVIVVSDASTDGTDEIVRRFAADGVRLIVQESRSGKTAGLNRAMQFARGHIVLFTDANSAYTPETIGTLVRYFGDPRVGMVTGYTRYGSTADGALGSATNLYTRLERVIKRAESASGCCVGADGAVFAIRTSLYRSLREDDINDFVIPLNIIDQGYACVLAEDVFCSELPSRTLESEFRRQSRITNRTLRALFRHVHLLNPWRSPMFAFFLFSHKLVRFLVPLFLGFSALSLLFLWPRGYLYAAGAIAAATLVVMVVLARARANPVAAWPAGARFIRFVDVLLTVNLAVLHGWWKFAVGRADISWQHDRSQV